MAALSDLTAKCIRCGFCLESCPTFVISGDECESPRGRIYLARSAEAKLVPLASIRPAIDTCVGCRACETACPSAVPYGEILEAVRGQMPVTLKTRALLTLLSRPRLFRLALWLARTALDEPQIRLTLPRADSFVPPEFPDPGGTRVVAVLQGCAAGVLFPGVNGATTNLLRRVGHSTVLLRGCCGALHAHNGMKATAEKMSTLGADGPPIVTNSAGCGSWLKGCGRNVFDACEFLADLGLADQLKRAPGLGPLRIAYHEACHLSHGQGIRSQPRQLLSSIPGVELVEVPDGGLCCGSGGVYNVLQPERAKELLMRKCDAIRATKCDAVVTGNPGCLSWLRTGLPDLPVLHTVTLLEASFAGRCPGLGNWATEEAYSGERP